MANPVPPEAPSPTADADAAGSPELDPMARLFGGPTHLGSPSGRRRRSPRRLIAGGAAAAVLLVGGVAVAGTGSPSASGYRTTTAGTHTVDQLLDAVATIEPVSQASVAFPVSGTVASVDVAVGDTVQTGDRLATLDTESLLTTLHERQAALDDAELLLEKALAGEDVSGLAGGGSGTGGASGSPTGAASGLSEATSSTASVASSTSARATAAADALDSSTALGGVVSGVSLAAAPTTTSTTPPAASPVGGTTDAELRAAQQAVLDATEQVDAALAAAQQALDSATQVCAAVGQPADPTSVDETTTTTMPGGTTTTTSPSSDDTGIAACRDALQAVLDAQQVVATDQASLAMASNALTTLLEQRAAAGAGSGTGTGIGAGGGTGTGSSGTGTGIGSGSGAGSGPPSGSGSGTSTTTSSPSAEQLVAYQKAVDAAAAQVAVATQGVEQASIVTPIAGTVAAVDLAVGDAVESGSSTATVVVVGAGGYEVSTTVSVDDIGDVEVGQPATVAPDGVDATVTGEVVGIGVAGTTSGSTTTYPVTIGINGDSSALGNGATASVSIVTDAAAEALAVPTSAVTTAGTRHTVTVLDGSKATVTTVEVGAVGDTWTEITEGIHAGDVVVLADLDEALPGSATDSSGSAGTTGDRQFPGAGGFPGGGTGTGGPPSGAGGFTGQPPTGN